MWEKLILTIDKIITKITNRKWVDSWIAKFFKSLIFLNRDFLWMRSLDKELGEGFELVVKTQIHLITQTQKEEHKLNKGRTQN